MLKLKLKHASRPLPENGILLDAAAAGITALIKKHLLDRDGKSIHASGMPRSGYWGDAANSVWVHSNPGGGSGVQPPSPCCGSSRAEITIEKEGVALHYFGGVIYPTAGKKALAIPVSPAAAGKRAQEFDPTRERLALVWPKGKSTGALLDTEDGHAVYLLVSHATIKANPAVLPSDDAIYAAGAKAIEKAAEVIA